MKQIPRISSDYAWHRMGLLGLTGTLPTFSPREYLSGSSSFGRIEESRMALRRY